jgi:hypothetical protein
MKTLARSGLRAFVLFETMLAVAIFAFGVLALGKCVENCLKAEVMKEDDARARRVLENRMLEIQAGVVQLVDSSTEDLKGPFTGMKLKTKRSKLKFQNEEKVDFEIEGVALEVLWPVDGRENSRTLEFYVQPRR